jgi:Tol biopolymer transport system component
MLSKGAKSAVIERAPVFGGTPQVIVKETWSSFALSPDGRRLAFFRGYGTGQDIRLLVVDMIAGDEHELIRSRGVDLWFVIWRSGPAWSPDGQKVAILAGSRGADGDHEFLLEVRPEDRSSRQIPGARWHSASQQAWLPDGTGLIVSARERAGAPYQLWLVNYPNGEMRRLTNDLNDYDKVSISPDGRRLVAQQETSVTHIWVVPDGDVGRARQLTSGANDTDGRNGLAWTPDGRLLFTSMRSGAYDIWVMKADGSDARALTADTGGANWQARATPDGRYVVFVSTRGGKENIWRMAADGSNAQRLTSGEGEDTPYLSPDGRWVYYTNAVSSPATIERVSIDGGDPQKVPNDANAANPIISPDGSLIAYEHSDEKLGWHSAVFPTTGGPPRLLDFHAFHGAVRWTPDARSIVYLDANRRENLWLQSLAGGPPRRLTNFAGESISGFDLSADGKNLAVARGNVFSDVVLITNFR